MKYLFKQLDELVGREEVNELILSKTVSEKALTSTTTTISTQGLSCRDTASHSMLVSGMYKN